jgi:hypothetical protein
VVAVDEWAGLVDAVSAAACEADPWQRAEWHLLDASFRDRLMEMGVCPSSESAVVLMAAAVFLAQHTCEWGGDARDALGELAQLGLRLLQD